jgi:hypothetical protein
VISKYDGHPPEKANRVLADKFIEDLRVMDALE